MRDEFLNDFMNDSNRMKKSALIFVAGMIAGMVVLAFVVLP